MGLLSFTVGWLVTQPLTLLADEKARLPLQAGFAEMDITPQLGQTHIHGRFGQNRKALKIHDPLKVRAVVLGQGRTNWRWFPST